MALALRFAARSDVGLLREGNEDSAYAGPRLLVVADGMGGHAAGEVASSVAVAALAALDEDSPGPELLDRLAHALEAANSSLRDMVEGDPALGGMGTTITALLRTGQRFGLVHVGDSRCYLLRGGELQQVTHDHTFVQSLVDEGRITLEEADHHPQRSLLTNALDGRGAVDADLSVREVRPGDRWMLCTDGLSGVVSADTIQDTLRAGDPDTAADALVELALRGGGPDNVTVIVADVVDVDSSPSDIPQVVGAVGSQSVRALGTPASGDGGAGTVRASAAARAAALAGASVPASSAEAEPVEEHRRSRLGRWLRVSAALVLALALVGGLAWGAYTWSRDQYYVGTADETVAIYRGLTQNVLGVSLSTVYEEEDIALDALSDYSRRRVESTISAASLADARQIVERLDEEAAACERIAATPPPTGTATPSPPPGGPATEAPSVPTPRTSPTPAVPAPRTTAGDRACPGVAS